MTSLVAILIVAFILLLVAIYFVLVAIWELRKGANRRSFIIKGMIGIGLILLVFGGPYLYFIGLGLGTFRSMTSPGITVQSSSSTIPMNNIP